MSPDLEPEEIRFDDLTSLTDFQPTDHGVEVTVRNLALWLLSLMEADSDVASMRVLIGASRAPLSSLQREPACGEGDDAVALVLR